MIEHVLIGVVVVVPEGALLGVARRKLPVLLRSLDPFQESLLLLLLRDVEEEFQDHDAVVREVLFEVVDVLEATIPNILVLCDWRQPLPLQDLGMDADDQDFLVIRTVEDTDASPFRQPLRAPPEVVVVARKAEGAALRRPTTGRKEHG